MQRLSVDVRPHLTFSSVVNNREAEMEVVFGTPSRNCSGAGICLVMNRSAKLLKRIVCPHAPALIYYNSGKELVFRFRKRLVDAGTVSLYFNKEGFLVEEPFSLPHRLVRQWNLPITQVQPGRYLLEEYSSEWRLYFPISMQDQP